MYDNNNSNTYSIAAFVQIVFSCTLIIQIKISVSYVVFILNLCLICS